MASAMDVMTQRLKSLEGLSKSMRPDLLRQLELLPLDRGGLATSTEVQMNHEAKALQKSTNRPWEERSKGKEKGEKGKWKGGKSENKSIDHDKKKEKGDGKKKS